MSQRIPHSTICLDGHNAQAKRIELKDYFNETWEIYESLFDVIACDSAFYQKPEPLRHPLIFYYGHTATFFINKLKLSKFFTQRINAFFESLFAIGVDEMSWDDLDEAHYDWPTVAEVKSYRNKVKIEINQLIDAMPLELPITQESCAWVILMGIEHERIHLETSSVLIRQLPIEYVRPHPLWQSCKDYSLPPENELLPVQGQQVYLGKQVHDLTYGWDNEYGRLQLDVENFKAAKYLVSNQEFLAFIKDDGYKNKAFWSEEGQKWLAYSHAVMPTFWVLKQGQYWQRNLCEEIPLPLNWPVEVNQLEAKAFCNWKASKTNKPIRLPTEAEWAILRKLAVGEQDNVLANIKLSQFASSCPINVFSHEKFYDVIGNVWQWTETPINGFDGFEVHPFYDDFSTPTFDGKHNLIKGGSWISTGNEAIASSRYAFRRHFFQHAGFRYVESAQTPIDDNNLNIYETDELISQYLEFHYGQEYFGVSNFCVNGVTQALNSIALTSFAKALDIGCSVGRASFELAKTFEHVDAIDFSARFISQAYELTEKKQKRYTIATEGELVEYKTIDLTELNYQHITNKLNFVQGDACNLKPVFTDYDFVLAANLIDRLHDPKKFLTSITCRINPRGYLVIMSPYTWLEDYTKKENWLGGIKINGENHTTLDGLTEILINDFELIAVKEIPFVIRETKRKFQHSLSEMSIWRKR